MTVYNTSGWDAEQGLLAATPCLPLSCLSYLWNKNMLNAMLIAVLAILSLETLQKTHLKRDLAKQLATGPTC